MRSVCSGALDGGVYDDQTDFAFYEDEMRRYYSNIVGKYSPMVQKALAKLRDYPIRTICPLHGLVWRTDPCKVIGLYDRWSSYQGEDGVVVIYASMYGNTAQMADYIARRIAEAGVKRSASTMCRKRIFHTLSTIFGAIRGGARRLRLQPADVSTDGEPDARVAAYGR